MDREQIVIIVLAAGLAVVGVYAVYRKWGDRFTWLLAKKRKVDGLQQEYTKLATILAMAQLTHLADLAGKAASIAVAETFKAIRDLRKLVQEPGGLLRLLTENFYWQFPQRCEDEADVKRLAAAVAKEPKLMAAVEAIKIEQAKADAAPKAGV